MMLGQARPRTSSRGEREGPRRLARIRAKQILPLHPVGGGARLEEAGAVHDQDPARVAEALGDVVLDRATRVDPPPVSGALSLPSRTHE